MRYKAPYTLYKRGKYWYYRTYSPDGLRTAGTSTGLTSKSAAREFCDKLYLNGSLYVNDLTFGSFSKNFLKPEGPFVKDRTKPLATNTLLLYDNLLNYHLLPKLHNVKLSDITYIYLRA